MKHQSTTGRASALHRSEDRSRRFPGFRAALATLASFSLAGCNLANYERIVVREFVEIEDLSKELLSETALLRQGPEGDFEVAVEQEYEVDQVAVSKTEVTRTVHEASPLTWVVSEALTDPLLFTLFLLTPFSSEDDKGLHGRYAAAQALLPLPGVTYAPDLTGEIREETSVEVGDSVPHALERRVVEVTEGLRVLSGDGVVEPVGGRLNLRSVSERALSAGELPSVTIEIEQRRHEVELTAAEAAASAAALCSEDVRWLRAIEYHGLLHAPSPADPEIAEALRGALEGPSGSWMAPMEASDWEVVISSGKMRMSDGAVVDFQSDGAEVEGAGDVLGVEELEVDVQYPGGTLRGEFLAQVTVTNRSELDWSQLVVVLDSPGTGCYPVPIGRVPPGGSVRRFTRLRARYPVAPPSAALHQWPGAKESRTR